MRGERLGWRLAGALLALALVATACGDDDDDGGAAATSAATAATAATTSGSGASTAATGASATTTAAAAKPACTATVAGTKVNYGGYIWATALDPVQALGSYYGGTELAAVYDVLMRYDFEADKYVPQVAESMTSNAAFTVWTLKLPPNLKFPNGDPFDIDNLFASLDRFAAPGVRNTSISVMKTITSREKVDARTATFTLSKPWAGFPYVFSREPGMVVNTKAIGADVAAFGLKPPPEAGIGPYVVDHWTPKEELVFKARSDYWGGPVCIETLRFLSVQGGQASYDAYRNNDLDTVLTNEQPIVNKARADGQPTITEVVDASPFWYFNFKEGSQVTSLKVRQAIAYAIDTNSINERGYGGSRLMTRALIHESSGWYSSDMKQLPGPDPAKARQLLAEAKAEGFDGKINLQSGAQPPFPDVQLTTKAMLDAVGFETTSELIPASEASGRVIQKDFNTAVWGYSLGQADAPVSVQSNLRSDSSANNQSYKNPTLDAAIDQLLAAPTRQDAKAAMTKINNILVDDVVWIPWGSTEIGLVHKAKLKGLKQTQQIIFLFDKAYLEQ